MKEHKEIILRALNDYRMWFGTLGNLDNEDDAEQLDAIDSAIDAVAEV